MNDQKVFKFENSNFYFEEDFCISNSNKKVYDFLNLYPKWESKLINIHGPKLSGKSHMLNIFKNKINSTIIDYELLKKTKNVENILNLKCLVLDNLNSEKLDEKLLFILINAFINSKNYLLIVTRKPLIDYKVKLLDLKSRIITFDQQKIENPSDELIYTLLTKFFSDKQLIIKKEMILYIAKVIDRSYDKIFNFVNDFDNFLLQKKKNLEEIN
tara:strand:+ start:36075 stop:36716 length:642 start_codon:yes stop_codon:yes gene_type:complete